MFNVQCSMFIFFCTFARVNKSGCRNGGMVDTRDLKSLGHNGCVGSSPTFGTVFSKKEHCRANSEMFFLILRGTKSSRLKTSMSAKRIPHDSLDEDFYRIGRICSHTRFSSPCKSSTSEVIAITAFLSGTTMMYCPLAPSARKQPGRQRHI